jgi:hypothetical protein
MQNATAQQEINISGRDQLGDLRVSMKILK